MRGFLRFAVALSFCGAVLGQEPEEGKAQAQEAIQRTIEQIDAHRQSLKGELKSSDRWPGEAEASLELLQRAARYQDECLRAAVEALREVREGRSRELRPEQLRCIERAKRFASGEATFIPEDESPEMRAALIYRLVRLGIVARQSKINSIVVQGRALNDTDHRIMAEAEEEIQQLTQLLPGLMSLAGTSAAPAGAEFREAFARGMRILQGRDRRRDEGKGAGFRESGDAFPPEARRRALELERLSLEREKGRLRIQVEEQKTRVELFKRRMEVARIEREIGQFEREIAARGPGSDGEFVDGAALFALTIDLRRAELSYRLSTARLAMLEAEQAHLTARIQVLEVLGDRE